MPLQIYDKHGYGFTSKPYTSKTKRNECIEDCKNQRQHGSKRCAIHKLTPNEK